jgi:hypothetical protein
LIERQSAVDARRKLGEDYKVRTDCQQSSSVSNSMTELKSRPKPNPPLESRRHPKSAIVTGAVGGTIFTVAPETDFQSTWSRNALYLHARYSRDQCSKYTEESANQYGAGLSGARQHLMRDEGRYRTKAAGPDSSC